MDLANTPFFSLLRSRLDQLSTRQQLIAENIAQREFDRAPFSRFGLLRANAMVQGIDVNVDPAVAPRRPTPPASMPAVAGDQTT